MSSLSSLLIVNTIQGLTDPNTIAVPQPPPGDNSNKPATTSWVLSQLSGVWNPTPLGTFYTGAGNVGIGTTTPLGGVGSNGLEVTGNVQIDGHLSLPNFALSTAYGGLGMNTIGTANQLLGVNNGGSALEYKTINSPKGTINITNSTGVMSIDVSSTPITAPVNVAINASVVGSQPEINFIPAGNVTITGVNNTSNNRVDLTVQASGSGSTYHQAMLLMGA